MSEIDDLRAEIDTLRDVAVLRQKVIEQHIKTIEHLGAIARAARDLDAHRDEGYATLVSYLIRLREALREHGPDGLPVG